jgi:hypothetical protein
MFDALTNPDGLKLTIERWGSHALIRDISRRRGYAIPGVNTVNLSATPARAFLNHGVWRAWCPECPYAADDVWKGHSRFWCMTCGNRGADGLWRRLIWPENLEEIESALDPFPRPAQNWEPWGESKDIVSEAQAWVDHAAVMVDPEHGLSDNAVSGADDPETYTIPSVAVTNAIIASSAANADKGNLRYFRQFMPANPTGANEVLQSSGADSAAWVSRVTAVVAALFNATLSGPVTFPNGPSNGIKAFNDAAVARAIASVDGDNVLLGDPSADAVVIYAALGALFTHDGATLRKIWTEASHGYTSGLIAEDSAKLGGVAAADYAPTIHTHSGSAKIAKNFYVGNGTSQLVSTGFTVDYVLIRQSTAQWSIVMDTNVGFNHAPSPTNLISSFTGVALGATGFTPSTSLNVNGVTYNYIAVGH